MGKRQNTIKLHKQEVSRFQADEKRQKMGALTHTELTTRTTEPTAGTVGDPGFLERGFVHV